jgi:cyclophilin family peptidyl-prolyl cis-trans isomerase
MPSEKRQRQDEARYSRRTAEAVEAKRRQRRRQLRTLAIIVAAVAAVALGISVLGGDDDDPVETADATSTSTGDEAAPAGEGDDTAGDPAIGETPCPPVEGAPERTTTFASGPQACIDPVKAYTATIETSRGSVVVDLDPAAAPKAVNSFVFLARHRYYEGVPFHRIIPGFVVQGGDANGEPPGTGGPGYSFADELPTGEAPHYEVGSLAMANSGADANGSQFFIVTGEQGVDLPPSYTRFGTVVEGMDVVQAIEATGSANGTPSEPTTIAKVTITEG